LRERLGLSQTEFAASFGISVRTIQQWEQGRTTPDQPARVLLRVIECYPDAVCSAIRPISASAVADGASTFFASIEGFRSRDPLPISKASIVVVWEPTAKKRFVA
jgi:transcriptional regulator with XRE-family HTH domain